MYKPGLILVGLKARKPRQPVEAEMVPVCMYVCMYVHARADTGRSGSPQTTPASRGSGGIQYAWIVCMYVCVYVCMYVCVFMYVYMYVCMYVYMYVCMYVCMCVCVCTCQGWTHKFEYQIQEGVLTKIWCMHVYSRRLVSIHFSINAFEYQIQKGVLTEIWCMHAYSRRLVQIHAWNYAFEYQIQEGVFTEI